MNLGSELPLVLALFACLGYMTYLTCYNARLFYLRHSDGGWPKWRALLLASGCLLMFALDLGALVMKTLSAAEPLLGAPSAILLIVLCVHLAYKRPRGLVALCFAFSTGFGASLQALAANLAPESPLVAIFAGFTCFFGLAALSSRFKRYFDALPAPTGPSVTITRGDGYEQS